MKICLPGYFYLVYRAGVQAVCNASSRSAGRPRRSKGRFVTLAKENRVFAMGVLGGCSGQPGGIAGGKMALLPDLGLEGSFVNFLAKVANTLLANEGKNGATWHPLLAPH